MERIEIVAATRCTPAGFSKWSPLGRSLRRLSDDTRITVSITADNRTALANVYNARIDSREGADILVFVHDDVWLDDYNLADHLLQGLRVFDVLGVAGNRRRVANQPGWPFVDEAFKWDSPENLSGAVAHGDGPAGIVSFYGPMPAACELMDGVLLAARKSTLLAKSVRFDPVFDFHFYDMDFCRTARGKGLSLGTWPVAVTHSSEGGYGTPEWLRNREKYQKKWGS